MFNGHFSSETWLKKNLMVSSGLSYSHVNDDYSGSRIYGSEFGAGYTPNSQYGFGYFGLGGVARMDEYVMDLNLFSVPLTNVTVVPSIRVQKEDWDADSTGLGTLGDNTPASFSGHGDRGMLDVRERLDLRYNGITNWVLYARGELTEGNGNLKENGGLATIGQIGVSPVNEDTDDTRFFQKYSAGARWYPTKGVALDGGGYYKLDHYSWDNSSPGNPNPAAGAVGYPGFLDSQDFETYDANLRLTLRPWRNVTLVSRVLRTSGPPSPPNRTQPRTSRKSSPQECIPISWDRTSVGRRGRGSTSKPA